MQHAAIARPKPLIVVHLLLLLAEEPRHGYELAASLKHLEFQGITPSTIYRELSRLEADGLVRSFWEASQARGPARHMYELTPAGRDDLGACANDIRCLIGHLNVVLDRVVAVAGNGAEASTPAAVRARRRFWKAP
jgi:PadR family transcriptional regulator, regulatory protein PadR